jgi:L-lactate dehydrogenase complex protein LldG
MSSRESILNKIKLFQNDEKLEIKTFDSKYENKLEEFIQNATLAGGVVYTDIETQKETLNKIIDNGDFFIYTSRVGVAENGALWCEELGEDRKKLFLCNDLVIRIKKDDIVSNMHEAYDKISFDSRAFGTFIAGPSKTADIEQSLVLGAHGAMGLYIFIED